MRANPMLRQASHYRPVKGDDLLVVSFDVDERKNEVASRRAGHAVYDAVETIRIQVPGDRNLTVNAPVESQCTLPDGTVISYKERFPEDYERWKSGHGAALSGMPLKMAPFLDKPDVSNLNAQNVFTVEQLADMGGQPLRNLGMSGRKWQQQAKAYLEQARGSRDATAAAARDAEQQARIAQLEETVRRLAEGAPVAMEARPDAAEEQEPAEDPDVVDEDERSLLKAEIERITGHRPRGNPSVKTLRAQLSEVRG